MTTLGSRRESLWVAVALFAATATTLNAIWMWVHPSSWYSDLPAAVPDFGPYNEHFIRDIGCAFAACAIALGWAIRNPLYRFPLCVVATAFLSGHALLHVYDNARGAVPAAHWWIDLPGVFAPALVMVWLSATCRPRVAAPSEIQEKE